MISKDCDYLTTLLLTLFLGAFGGQYFYTRQYGMAAIEIVACIITAGAAGLIWQIIDLVRVTRGTFITKEGYALTHHPKHEE